MKVYKKKMIKNRRKYEKGKRENLTYFPPSYVSTCCAWKSNIKLHKFEVGTLHSFL